MKITRPRHTLRQSNCFCPNCALANNSCVLLDCTIDLLICPDKMLQNGSGQQFNLKPKIFDCGGKADYSRVIPFNELFCD